MTRNLQQREYFAGTFLSVDAKRLVAALEDHENVIAVAEPLDDNFGATSRVFFTADTDVTATHATSFVNGYRACLVDLGRSIVNEPL